MRTSRAPRERGKRGGGRGCEEGAGRGANWRRALDAGDRERSVRWAPVGKVGGEEEERERAV